MAGEIQIPAFETGKTLYAVVRNSVGQAYRADTQVFEAYSSANLTATKYALALTEQGAASRYYAAAMPAVAAGTYDLAIYKQAGGAPAEGDVLVGAGTLEWDGAAVVPLSSRSTYAGGDTAGTTTLLARLSAARAGYLDNLNVGGPVASHADVLAINQSSSKHLILQTVGQYERPEAGSVTYTIEARTFAAADGSAVNADTTPTLTATGNLSGSLTGNLSAATNPATGVYRWDYTVASGATLEQVRFDVSATIAAATFTLSCYSQVADFVSSTWTTADRANLVGVKAKTDQLTFTVANHVDATASGGGGGDPLTNPVPGSYASGTAGAALGHIGSGQITTVSPVSQGGAVALVQGDDYLAADGRAIDWTDVSAAWPDLTGATVAVQIYTGGALVTTKAGSVVTPSGVGKKVRWEPTAADTAALLGGYKVNVVATLAGGHKNTLVRADLTVAKP